MDSRKIKALARWRSALKLALTRIQSFVSRFPGTQRLKENKVPYENSLRLWTELSEFQSLLEVGDDRRGYEPDLCSFEAIL
jgi:hypothetical protein